MALINGVSEECRVKRNKIMKTFVLRLYDMFDGWIDIEDELTEEEAKTLYDEKTNNGTEKICFADGDYYEVFPSDTKMLITPERLGR